MKNRNSVNFILNVTGLYLVNMKFVFSKHLNDCKSFFFFNFKKALINLIFFILSMVLACQKHSIHFPIFLRKLSKLGTLQFDVRDV